MSKFTAFGAILRVWAVEELAIMLDSRTMCGQVLEPDDSLDRDHESSPHSPTSALPSLAFPFSSISFKTISFRSAFPPAFHLFPANTWVPHTHPGFDASSWYDWVALCGSPGCSQFWFQKIKITESIFWTHLSMEMIKKQPKSTFYLADGVSFWIIWEQSIHIKRFLNSLSDDHDKHAFISAS